ncbi:MAG: YgjV family protein [Oscillospiraceae bacterium]|nr:YgjV family protein [Oscillospiraceae bacterium]
MTLYDIIAQGIGIIAMAFNIYSFQMKTSNKVILCQMIGGFFFSVSFFMLGATVGGILNAIAAFRAIIYMNEKKFHADHILWLVFFECLFVLSYILTFTVFGKEMTVSNTLIELLPVIGMTASTISFRINNAKAIRLFGLISSPSWLIYNIINFAVGAIVCEVLSLFSIFIGLWRYDRKK